MLLISIYACGNNSGTSHEMTSIVFSVDWQGAAAKKSTSSQKAEQGGISAIKNKIDCAASGVSTVEANVYDNAETHLAGGGQWNCNDHSGKITGSMAGSSRKIVVTGKDAGGKIIYQGESAGISIAKGQTTDAGTINVYSINSLPAANAGPDQTVSTGDLVTLDGSGSSDTDGDPLTYNWSFTSTPDGSNVSLSDSTIVYPTFTPDINGTYELSLIVNDGFRDSAASIVTITVPVNYALSGVASQSSTYSNGAASRVIDGNTNGDFFYGSVSHTGNDQNAWWMVDLGSSYPIDQIVLWNRTDCCVSRLTDFHVSVLDSGGSEVWRDDYFTGGGYFVNELPISLNNVSGQFVKVQLNGTNYLQLAEVQVFDGVKAMTSTLPDTGQTTSYTDTFGEDSDYTINPISYTDNGNGTVTDNVTSLMWQQEEDDTTRTWADAGTYCDGLTLAGYSDWRLPAKKELISIVNYETYLSSIDTTYFPNTNSSNYWSATTYVSNTSYAWVVYFYDGYVPADSKSSNYYVRCVRGGQ